MDTTYWFKQTTEPLFPEIEWNKPERRNLAGKLLIIGGNKQGFASIGKAYQDARDNNIGEVKLIMPDSLRNLPMLQHIPECLLAKSTKTGNLGLDSWSQISASLIWADWVLLPGDIGHNPETVQLLQKLIATDIPLSLSDSVLELLLPDSKTLAARQNTIIFCEFKNLQKLAINLEFTPALTSSMNMVQLVECLHKITQNNHFTIVTNLNNMQIVAEKGQVSTTKVTDEKPDNNITKATIYGLQNLGQTFKALTQAYFE